MTIKIKDITPFNPLLYCVAVETTPNEFLLMKNGIESQCENWEWKLLEEHIEEVYVNDSCINLDQINNICPTINLGA